MVVFKGIRTKLYFGIPAVIFSLIAAYDEIAFRAMISLWIVSITFILLHIANREENYGKRKS